MFFFILMSFQRGFLLQSFFNAPKRQSSWFFELLSNYYCVRGSAMESVAFPRFYFPIRFWCILDHLKANHDCFSNCEKYLHLIGQNIFVDLWQEVLIATWRHHFLALLLYKRILKAYLTHAGKATNKLSILTLLKVTERSEAISAKRTIASNISNFDFWLKASLRDKNENLQISIVI